MCIRDRSWTICHMNSPSASRNAIRTPLSPVTFGSFSPSLLVPTKTMPPATTTLPYVCEPSWATHFTFFLVLTSQLVGSPFMFETMLRSAVPPHMGQSPEPGSEADADGARQYTAAVNRSSAHIRAAGRLMMALELKLLNLICLRTPLCCRSRVQRDRCQKFQVRPGGSESDRCVQSSMRPVRVRLPAMLYHVREFFRPAGFGLQV